VKVKTSDKAKNHRKLNYTLMKKSTFIFVALLLFLISCASKSNSQEKQVSEKDQKSDLQDEKPVSEVKKMTSDELAGLLPESIPGFPMAQQVLKSSNEELKISASRQFLDEKYKSYVKVVISDYPQDKDNYEKNWAYNKSFENDSRKTTAERQGDVDMYEVIMKDGAMKFTTFYLNHRFEVYIESKGAESIEIHKEVAKPILDKLRKLSR
jgi:hypothetical protein